MVDKSLEERIENLEAIHGISYSAQSETLDMKSEDSEKAKKKGGLFGDPIFVVE